MILNLIKRARDRRVMQEVVMQGFEEACARVSHKCTALTVKLSNGGGEAIIRCFENKK